MEFNSELSAFQGVLLSVDNVHQFSKLTSRGGNEDKIDYVVQGLKRFLEMEKYIDENGLVPINIPSTRKFAIYIVLNSDLPVLQSMVDLKGIESVIWSIPTVPKHLMCEILWQLPMEMFIYEIIGLSWPQLGLEVADAFLENMKYANPTKCLDKLYNLSLSCYALMLRLNYYEIQDEEYNNIIQSAFNILQKYLNYYIGLPNKHKLNALNTDNLYKIEGLRLISVAKLAHVCFNMQNEMIKGYPIDPIYKLTYKEESHFQDENSNKLEHICLHNSKKLILDTLQEIAMGISVDIFCSWSEFDHNGQTMQVTAGHICHNIYTMLENKSSEFAEHPVKPIIKLMALKPLNIFDNINSVSTDTILQRINSQDQQSVNWLRALLHRDDLCHNRDLIRILRTNIHIFNPGEYFVLFDRVNTATVSCLGNDELHYFKTELFSRCSTTHKHVLLKGHYKNKLFSNSPWAGNDFIEKLTQIFNKIIVNIDTDYSDILTMFYQNPEIVYDKVYSLAIQNARLCEPMVRIMTLLSDYHSYSYLHSEPCSIKTLKAALTSSLSLMTHSRNFINFVIELKKRQIISSQSILMAVVMPCIHRGLVQENFRKLHILLKLLVEGYSVQDLFNYKATMLVMTAQIMERTRMRTLGTFQQDALIALDTAIIFQKHTMRAYDNVIPDRDAYWMKHKLREISLHPLNFYYYKRIWNYPEKSFFETVTEQCVKEVTNINLIGLHLTQILPWATTEEWCEVWDNLIAGDIKPKDALRLFHSAIDVLIHTVNTNRTDNTLACLALSYRNLMHIARYKFFKEPLSDNQVKNALSLIWRNLIKIRTRDVGLMEPIIIPLLAYLAERKGDFSVNCTKWFVNTNYFNIFNRFLPLPTQGE